MLIFADLARPENLHEIARLRLINVIEISAQLQLMKKAGGARSVCVPAAPDSFAITLVPDDQPFEGGVVEMKLPSPTQGLNCSDEHQIGRARAETRRSRRRQNEKLAGLKMCRPLQADLGEV